jgi:hypothetical protein
MIQHSVTAVMNFSLVPSRVDSIQQSEDWKESVTINQKSVMFKLDTGAQANIISDKLFRSVSLANSTLEKTGVKLVT